MASGRWYIDGWELTSGDGRDVESKQGWEYVPDARGEATTVANRTGVIWNPKRRGAGSFGLEMWFAGDDEEEALAQYELALRAATPTHRLVVIRRVMPDGSARVCDAELVGAITPTPVGRQGYRASLQFSIPDGPWRSENQYAFASVANSATLLLPSLVASTAPIERIALHIAGPATNPVVRDVSVGGNGDWVRYAGTVPAGATLSLDSWTWGISGAGFAPNKAAITMKGSRFLCLYPIPPAQPNARHTLSLEASSWALSAGALQVRARTAHH